MKTISSSDNKTVRLIRSLSQKKYRDRERLYLVEGENLVAEALMTGTVRFVVLSEDYDAAVPKGDAAFLFMEGKLFRKLALTESSQGILAVVEQPEWDEDRFLAEVGEGNLLVLDQIQDPGNLGTMLRTALAAGYKGAVVLKGSGDVYGPKTVRAAAGALFRLPILRTDTVEETVSLLRKAGKKIVGTGPRESRPFTEVDMTGNCALIIGNEGNGMREGFFEAADVNVVIPMADGIESLNAAVAAGILMYRSVV